MPMIIILLRIEQTLTVTVPIDSSRLIPPTLIIHSVALRNQMRQSPQKVNTVDINISMYFQIFFVVKHTNLQKFGNCIICRRCTS